MTQDDFQLEKIITMAQIAGRLVYASVRITAPAAWATSKMAAPQQEEEIEFSLSPERAVQIAEQIFDAAEARVREGSR